MLVLDGLLISNNERTDGAIIGGTFRPAEDGKAANLELITAGGQIILEGDAAILLFAYYETNGTRLDGAKLQYTVISREAVMTLNEEFGNIEYQAGSRAIIDTLLARL